MYDAIVNLLSKLGLLKYAEFVIFHNQLANRIWLEIRISTCRDKEILLKYIIEQAKNDSVIYDIGAHQGIYSIVLAQLFPNSVIYSFEPNPIVYSLLLKNIKRKGLIKRIVPLNFALSNKNEMSDFFISSVSVRSSLHTYYAAYDCKIDKAIKMQCFSTDYLVENNICKPPDIIKIDTEGHEYEIIMGARETIAKFHPAIGFEPHGIETRDLIEKHLSAQGYTIKSLGYHVWCEIDRNS